MKKGLLAPQNTFLDTIATRFDGTHSNFVLGNAQATGCPVVYCSDGFCELSGFPRSQVMGRSCACKFLFGDETTVDEKEKIESALENKEELKTELYFYRKDGNRFKCLLDIVPIKNEKSQVVLILVSHKDIGDKNKRGEENDDDDDKSSSEMDSDEEMAEAYRRCQARQGRSSGALPGTAGYASQRRRSRAVLYHLSGQFEKHNRATRAKSKLQQLNKFSSISGKMPEYKVQEVKKSKFILVHYGIFKIGWDWLILLCTFYTAILVPYNAAFTRAETKNQRDSIYSDVVVEILFMFDILFNFRTSFVNKSGQVVYEARLIAVNYIKGWFLLDLLAAIPFDFLYIFNINAKAPVHLLKLARLIRLARLLQKIDRFSQYIALVLALLMSMFTLLAHWLACIWYAIGHVEFENNTTAGWLWELSERLDLNHHIGGNNSRENDTIIKPDVLMSYLSALYFTCSSLTSVGFGNVSANTNSEKIFSICAMIVGALMHAVVFGNVTALIQRMYQRRANFHSKTKDLKDFFRAYDIPKPLKQRMQEYFQTMWSMNNGIETNEILKDFPEEMKGELGLHLHKEILNLPIFEEATQGCLKSIALHTRRSFCAPGEFLVHKGDASNYLYLLVSGSMEVLKMDMVVAILGKADLFGSDIDFDDPISVCNYDVRSLTYSELQCISIKGLTDVLLLYPDFAEKFAKDIHNDLTYNLRQTGEDSDEETASSPKTRVCTLPSISEDDELSPSEDEEEDVKTMPVEKSCDDDEVESSIGGQSFNSPLLPAGRIFPKLPNGDVTMESVSSPPSVRPWGIRRSSGIMSRQSIKETRKIRLGTHTPETTEKIIPHVQTLQTEMEGTKAAIGKLERKVSRISQDISAIDRNMREILKHLTNASKMSPLEPLAPPTPSTPCLGAHFNFDFPEPFNNDAKQRASCDSISDMNTRGNRPPAKDVFDPRRRSSLQVPTFFRHHEVVCRRHSDSSKTEEEKGRLDFGNIMSKSECNVRDDGSSKNVSDTDLDQSDGGLRHHHDKLIDFSDDISVVETDYSLSNDNLCRSRSRLPSANTKTSSERGSDDKLEFMGKLEEVHSNDCKIPKDIKLVSDVCDKEIICDKDLVKKSSTFDTFRTVPKVTVNRDNSMPALKLQCLQTSNHNHFIDHEIVSKRETGIFLETLQSSRSKSCADISPKPARSKISPKAKSHDLLETEFGAKTPNEVRTIHLRGKRDFEKNKHVVEDTVIDDNLVATEKQKLMTAVRRSSDVDGKDIDRVVLKNDMARFQNNELGKNSPDSIEDPREKENSVENLRTDSGHASLPDNFDSESENKCKTASGRASPSGIEKINKISESVPRTNVSNGHEKLRRLKPDISPDSLTDISESLITDSVKTEDDTVIDVDNEPGVMDDIFGPLMDTSLMRTTDL